MIDARQGTKESGKVTFPIVGTSSEIDNLACCHTKDGSEYLRMLAVIRLRSTIVLIKMKLYLVVVGVSPMCEIERLMMKKIEKKCKRVE